MERMTTFGIMRPTYTCYFGSSSLLLTKNDGGINAELPNVSNLQIRVFFHMPYL